MPEKSTILLTAFFAAGMLVFSPAAARVGDAIGHLRTMTLLACVGVAMILGFVWIDSWAWMLAAIFVAGATLASISPVSLALQGHVARPRDYSRANAVYKCSSTSPRSGPCSSRRRSSSAPTIPAGPHGQAKAPFMLADGAS